MQWFLSESKFMRKREREREREEEEEEEEEEEGENEKQGRLGGGKWQGDFLAKFSDKCQEETSCKRKDGRCLEMKDSREQTLFLPLQAELTEALQHPESEKGSEHTNKKKWMKESEQMHTFGQVTQNVRKKKRLSAYGTFLIMPRKDQIEK